MTDQLSPWRDVAIELPDASTIVLICTEGGTLLIGWLAGRGLFQAIHPMEAMPYTRRKPRNAASDPPAYWMAIPPPPWNPERANH
jgi:hypothetical protein